MTEIINYAYSYNPDISKEAKQNKHKPTKNQPPKGSQTGVVGTPSQSSEGALNYSEEGEGSAISGISTSNPRPEGPCSRGQKESKRQKSRRIVRNSVLWT